MVKEDQVKWILCLDSLGAEEYYYPPWVVTIPGRQRTHLEEEELNGRGSVSRGLKLGHKYSVHTSYPPVANLWVFGLCWDEASTRFDKLRVMCWSVRQASSSHVVMFANDVIYHGFFISNNHSLGFADETHGHCMNLIYLRGHAALNEQPPRYLNTSPLRINSSVLWHYDEDPFMTGDVFSLFTGTMRFLTVTHMDKQFPRSCPPKANAHRHIRHLSLETSTHAAWLLYIGYPEVWWLMQVLEDDYIIHEDGILGVRACVGKTRALIGNVGLGPKSFKIFLHISIMIIYDRSVFVLSTS
ncbi:hypothetical protein K503DRAFT_784065 [Rhizopogon vinicolor AM-OR11-026]|uniref:Uncharacterized protein n=1 Tax=Rhizopogon vinicolor AM-OR11-026 TaxID=1314800 RepID=A0A1B7MW52_9AGAM|nr:hypothetical protein K503DRAFT_784065 [Rhizopogon vinicolor AM-OR11-026]